ncbi:unnamed protein product [Closterium sp. Yama58-4]|nr:unnamed protein product [Closterium sp. Yama58-4]
MTRRGDPLKAADLNRCSASRAASVALLVSISSLSPSSLLLPPPHQVMTRRGDPLKAADLTRCSSPSRAASVALLVSISSLSPSSLLLPPPHQVMTRRGDPLKAADLNRCSASRAASIVILSPQLPSRQQADAQVLQTAMALAVLPEIQGDVVAELACPENTMLLGKLHASLMKRLDRARQQHMLGSSTEAARLVTHAGTAATAITTTIPSPSAATASTATDATGSNGTAGIGIATSTTIPTGAASATTGHATPARTATRGLSSSAGQRRRKLVPVETGGMALRRLVDLALQPAGSAVAAELLRFKGAEFHFKEWKELEGRTFAEAVFMFEDAVPCGVQQLVGTEDERTLINPPGDTVIEPGDRLLVIAESAGSYAPRRPTAESAKERELAEKRLASFATPWHYDSLPRGNVRRRHNVLIAGEWRDDVAEALLLLGAKLAPRSQVAVMVDSPSFAAAQQRLNPFIKSGSLNLNLSLYHGHLGSMADLEKVPLEAFDTVIVLAPCSHHQPPPDQPQMRDDEGGAERGEGTSSRSGGAGGEGGEGVLMPSASVTAMMIRTIQRERGLTAMDPDVGGVLDEIVSGSGSSLSLEDATSFLVDGEALSFFDLQSRVLRRRKLMIAYNCANNGGKWQLNPQDKNKPLVDFIRFLPRIFRMAVVAAAVTARSPSSASASGASAGWLWPLIGTAASIAFASAFSLTLRILRGLSASRTLALHPPQAILVLGGNRYRERLAGRFAALLAAPYQPVTGNLSSVISTSSNSGLTQDRGTGNADNISSSGSGSGGGGGGGSSAAASGSGAVAACLAFDPIFTSSPKPLAHGTLDSLPPAHAAATGKLPVFISSGNDDAADVMMREGVPAGRLRVDNHALDTVTNFTTMLRTNASE